MNTRRTLREPSLPRRAAFALSASLLLALAGSITGCASSQRPADAASAEAIAGRPALSRLRTLALTEKPRPIDAPVPPGIDPAALTPAPTADPADARRAGLDMDAALAEVRSGPAPEYIPDSATPPAPVDPERAHQALRLYVSGRDARRAGQAASAITELEAAAQLDPVAPEVRLELAEAQLAAGKRLAASGSLQRAAALGSTSPRVYWLLAVDAVRGNSAANAAWLLARARELNPERQDPALPYLINAGLAEAMNKLGYASASVQLLELALDLPEQLPSQTAYRLEYSELIRRQAEAARDLGDARARLGDFQAAADFYDAAAELPTLDPGAILARRVYARVRAGRPAAAALLIAQTIEESGGLVEERQITLLSALIAPTPAAQPLSAALTELQRQPGREASPRATSGLVRAAAALSPATSRAALKSVLIAHPDDRDTVRALLGPADPADRIALVAEIAESSSDPIAIIRSAAEAIVDSGSRVSDTLSLLDRRPDDAAAILARQILLTASMPVPALDRAAPKTWTPRFRAAAAESQAFAAALAGRWDLYADAISTLDGLGSTAALARTRALLAGQRFKDAYAASLQAAATPATSVADLVTLARAAQLAGHPDQAAQFLNDALTLDRFDERGYEGLLSLYAPSGQQLDNEKLASLLRSLRQNIPSSRLVRWFAAQDMVQRGSVAQAERALLELADEDPGQASLINILSAIWERASGDTQTDAEAWLRARLARAPESIPLRVAKARLLAKQGKTDEALSACELSFDQHTPPELLRTRELILRQSGRTDQADLAAQERRALTGVGIDASIDLAEAQAAAGRLADAAASLSRGVPSGADLSPEQFTRIIGILSNAAQNPSTTLTADEFTALFAVAANNGVVLPPQLHEARIRRLGAMPDATFDQLGAAAALATRQYPTLSDIAYRRAAQTMIEAGRRDRAAAFLVSQLKLVPDVKEDLVFDTFALAASSGDADCINALLDTIDKPEWIDAIILKAGVTDEVPEEPDRKRVELAYILGVVLNDAGRDQLAELAYRRALALNPDHPWSNNNLGYQIAEAHGDLREAEAMLRRALAALPEEGSVLDSLAWILYKQGRLNDEVGPDGKPSPGAVSLLARASTSMRGSENPVILDHYGDALWSAGRTDQARQAWTQARQAVKNRLQMLRLANTNAPPSRAIQRDETLLAQIAAKLDALDAGKPPTLAEQPGVQPSPQTPAQPAGK